MTSDGSNVDSELSSHEEEHKSADDEVLNDWENDEAQKHEQQLNDEDELNLENKLDNNKDEREQGDGEVSVFFLADYHCRFSRLIMFADALSLFTQTGKQ